LPQPRQATLVAFYGDKPQPLRDLISSCQLLLADALGQDFCPYELGQVHATIVGLERIEDQPLLHNLNFRKHRGVIRVMDLPGFRDFVIDHFRVPMTVQLTGFQNHDYPFVSRGLPPFLRSFAIQGDKAVVMGWPIIGGSSGARFVPIADRTYPKTLDDLRVAAQAFGILHEYHRVPADFDNDFYFRIGLLSTKGLEPAREREIEERVRDHLAGTEPVLIQVSPAALSFVSYVDNTMPISTSVALGLTDVQRPSDFVGLYES
jgi:hypothetical protein